MKKLVTLIALTALTSPVCAKRMVCISARTTCRCMRRARSSDPTHSSLHFKTVGSGKFHSVRVGLYYRALGLPVEGGVHWFWIGTHGDYDKLVG